MLDFTLYTANCVGMSGNCLYPNKVVVKDKESFKEAVKKDHVTARYKGNYRSSKNFQCSDCIPLDCDNDHSDNPKDWVTPFDIAMEIPGVAFAVSYSRHHNLPKDNKSARPRFHIFFPIEAISDEKEYSELKKRIANKEEFSVLYLDLDNFKAYNDVYGFLKGDKIIQFTAKTILKCVHKNFPENSFVGHIGGDDFVAIIPTLEVNDICQEIIATFDKEVTRYFTKEDLERGYIEVANRKGIMEQFTLTSISIGAVIGEVGRFENILEIGEVGAQVKHAAKSIVGSSYAIDRRQA